MVLPPSLPLLLLSNPRSNRLSSIPGRSPQSLDDARTRSLRSIAMFPFPPKHIPPLGPRKGSTRDKIRAQWYGFNGAPAEKTLAASAKALGNVMPKVLSNIRIDRRRAEAEVVRVWN